MGYVLFAIAVVVALVLIQRYRRKHSASYYYPRSMQRMDETERMLESLDMNAASGKLTQSDLVRAEKRVRENAQWQRAQAVPHDAMMDHRAQYASMYAMYAMRLNDLAYNDGRNIALIDAYIEESARQTNQKADESTVRLNELMRQTGQPTRTREEWMRELGG